MWIYTHVFFTFDNVSLYNYLNLLISYYFRFWFVFSPTSLRYYLVLYKRLPSLVQT